MQLAGVARDVQNVVLQCHRRRFAFQEEGWEDMTLQTARWMYACAARCAFPAGSAAQLSMWQSASALLRCVIAEQLSGSPWSLELLLVQSDFRVNGGRWSRDMGDMIERIHARLSTGQQSLHGHNKAQVRALHRWWSRWCLSKTAEEVCANGGRMAANSRTQDCCNAPKDKRRKIEH